MRTLSCVATTHAHAGSCSQRCNSLFGPWMETESHGLPTQPAPPDAPTNFSDFSFLNSQDEQPLTQPVSVGHLNLTVHVGLLPPHSFTRVSRVWAAFSVLLTRLDAHSQELHLLLSLEGHHTHNYCFLLPSSPMHRRRSAPTQKTRRAAWRPSSPMQVSF